MKHFLKFILLLLPALAFAQVRPEYIPQEYDATWQAAVEKYQIAKAEGWDVVLPPEEQVGLLPNTVSMAAGNWGPEYLGINADYSAIKAKCVRKVAVFIMDTGDGYSNPELSGAAWNEKGRDFTGTSPAKGDANGHSTHCAGIVGAYSASTPLGAARMLSEKGLLKIIPYQVLSDAGSGSFAWITAGTLAGIDEAKVLQQQGYFVIFSYSLGGSTPSADLDAALKKAREQGIAVVCANGNTGGTPIQYPGKSAYVLGIAALAQSGSDVVRASYSSYGVETFNACPGSLILSTYKDNTLATLSGTSMATPHEAGVIAVLASVFSTATAEQLITHLSKYSTDLPPSGRDQYTGWGAPKIQPLLANSPGGSPGDPPPPPPDPSPRGKRTLIVQVENLTLLWREYSKADTRRLFFDATVELATTNTDEAATDALVAAMKDYYSRSMLVLPDGNGYVDAAYWGRHFAEILIPRNYSLSVVVDEVAGMDETGRKAVINDRIARYKPSAVLNRYMAPQVQTPGLTVVYKKKFKLFRRNRA